MPKNLIVTGGGRGIGHCTALLAAEAGWQVCVNYVSNDARAQATVDAIEKAGGKALAVKADITKEEDVVRLFETASKELGRLSGLVNSAGIVDPYGRVEELKVEDLEYLWRINITALIVCTREAIKRMSTKHGGDGGSIVNLSSVASRLGTPGATVAYAASKGAVDSFNWGVAQEVAGEGIRVNAISPGVINTEIQPEGRVESVGPNLPMGRVGKPEEIARLAVWLLSEEASYISGANIAASGAR